MVIEVFLSRPCYLRFNMFNVVIIRITKQTIDKTIFLRHQKAVDIMNVFPSLSIILFLLFVFHCNVRGK